MDKITVLIVDDSAFIRSLFKEMLSKEPDIEVLGTAIDPFDAREKIKALSPQVITLDIEMPKMDGLTFLEKIMSLRPMPVVMVSTLTQKGAGETIRALELGAIDYVSKPLSSVEFSKNMDGFRAELAGKIRIAAASNVMARRSSVKSAAAPVGVVSYTPPMTSKYPLIAIGSSTGGVEALRDIFLQLPANAPPIVMTQHMPAQFTTSMAARLSAISKINVAEATDGVQIRAGNAYVAPGGIHMRIEKKGNDFVCRLFNGENVAGHKPSVDVLFLSVAEAAGARAVGIILTGMGRDGAEGLLKMRSAGAQTIGQDEKSCVVYGMPRAAHLIGAVEKQLPLLDIAAHALRLCEQKGSS
jgi:two-component system chemotaxis response regulator CheB